MLKGSMESIQREPRITTFFESAVEIKLSEPHKSNRGYTIEISDHAEFFRDPSEFYIGKGVTADLSPMIPSVATLSCTLLPAYNSTDRVILLAQPDSPAASSINFHPCRTVPISKH